MCHDIMRSCHSIIIYRERYRGLMGYRIGLQSEALSVGIAFRDVFACLFLLIFLECNYNISGIKVHHLYLVLPPCRFDDGKCGIHFDRCLRKVLSEVCFCHMFCFCSFLRSGGFYFEKDDSGVSPSGRGTNSLAIFTPSTPVLYPPARPQTGQS